MRRVRGSAKRGRRGAGRVGFGHHDAADELADGGGDVPGEFGTDPDACGGGEGEIVAEAFENSAPDERAGEEEDGENAAGEEERGEVGLGDEGFDLRPFFDDRPEHHGEDEEHQRQAVDALVQIPGAAEEGVSRVDGSRSPSGVYPP